MPNQDGTGPRGARAKTWGGCRQDDKVSACGKPCGSGRVDNDDCKKSCHAQECPKA